MTNQLQVLLVEPKRFGAKVLNTQLRQPCSRSLTALITDLKGVEKAIRKVIAEDSALKTLFDLVTSVPGIGQVVATEIILATNELKAIDDPKKLACHAGVAAFEHSSGSSVKDSGQAPSQKVPKNASSSGCHVSSSSGRRNA